MSEYPCFPLFVDLSQRHVVVVGAGRIAARRVAVLAQFTPNITVVAPEVHEQIEALASAGRVRLARRAYEAADLEGADLALAATGDAGLNARICGECRALGIPVNVSSDRTLCDFYFPGVARQGGLVAGVSAGGEDHRLAAEATREVRRLLAERFGEPDRDEAAASRIDTAQNLE